MANHENCYLLETVYTFLLHDHNPLRFLGVLLGCYRSLSATWLAICAHLCWLVGSPFYSFPTHPLYYCPARVLGCTCFVPSDMIWSLKKPENSYFSDNLNLRRGIIAAFQIPIEILSAVIIIFKEVIVFTHFWAFLNILGFTYLMHSYRWHISFWSTQYVSEVRNMHSYRRHISFWSTST